MVNCRFLSSQMCVSHMYAVHYFVSLTESTSIPFHSSMQSLLKEALLSSINEKGLMFQFVRGTCNTLHFEWERYDFNISVYLRIRLFRS